MYLMGRNGHVREAYPGPPNGALVSLSNRYLIDPAGPGTPSAFTVTTPTLHVVAAVNVVRRASGIFVVTVQMPATLGAADQQAWSANMDFGATASGGVANGSWLIDASSTITISGTTGTSPMGVCDIQSGAGNLLQTVTLSGVNADPAPQGASAIVIFGATTGGHQITPGTFLAVAYELP